MLGYLYIKSSHFVWEQRYSAYQKVQSLRVSGEYPCGHDPAGTFSNSIVLANCLLYNGEQIVPYWLPFTAVADAPWAGFAHDPGRARGANYLLGDGSVSWVDTARLAYQYNGWAIIDWWKIR